MIWQKNLPNTKNHLRFCCSATIKPNTKENVKHNGRSSQDLRNTENRRSRSSSASASQKLLDHMKQDVMYTTVVTSYNPLQLISIVQKTVLTHMGDKYPFARVYKQELFLYGFYQNNMTNEQWYERLNTKVDVETAIGVTRQHSVLLK